MARRDVRLGSTVEIYRDPETETQLEGYAFVWHIEKETDRFFTLMVSFLGDREERKVLRDLKKETDSNEKARCLVVSGFFLCVFLMHAYCVYVLWACIRMHTTYT